MKKNIILLTLIFILSITVVYAKTNDSTLEKHRYEGIYTVYESKDETRLFYAQRYTLNNKTAYCIEPGVKIETNIYSSTTDLSLSNLSDEIINYISLVAYYGYDYIDHNTMNYYLAAQELMWRKITNNNIYWTTTLDKNGPKIDISKEKEEITKLIENHYKLPSFANQTFKRTAGSNITIQDYSEVLDNYEVYKVNVDNLNPKITNNELFLPKYNKVTTLEIILKRKDYQNTDKLLFYQENNQKLISSGSLDPIYVKIYVENKGASLTINLYDKDTKNNIPRNDNVSLENSVYEIFDNNNNLIKTLSTNKEGKIIYSNSLPAGNYYIKEKNPSIGYELDENKYNFNIVSYNNNKVLDIYKQIIKRDIEIYKYLKDNNSDTLHPDTNIKFLVEDSNNQIIENIITNEEGLAKINLLYGKYKVKQINNNKGLNKINDFEIIVNNNSPNIIKYVFSTDILNAKVKINNKDKDSLLNINNKSKFKIKDLEKEEYICQQITYPNKEKVCEYITNNGYFITPLNLNTGTYELVQIQKPEGYVENNESLIFRIDSNSEIKSDEYGRYIEYDYLNEVEKNNITITVKGEEFINVDNKIEYKKNNLANVEISLYAKEDIITSDNIIHYKKGELIEKLITNEEGKVTFNNLYQGIYNVVQTKIDNKYVNLLEEKEIILDKNRRTTIYNNLKKGDLKIIKIDSISKEKLSNIKINIYNEKDELINTNITNKSGVLKVNNLPIGKYYVKEIETITGYLLNERVINFEVKEDNELINLELESIPIIGSLELTVLDVLTNKGISNTNILLFDEKDKLIYEGNTNELGILIINNLRYGNHYITEKDNSKQERLLFEIKENDEVVKLKMIKENIIIDVPNTGVIDNYKIEIIGSILILFGLGELYVIKKKIFN